jgi:hypothetical protein
MTTRCAYILRCAKTAALCASTRPRSSEHKTRGCVSSRAQAGTRAMAAAMTLVNPTTPTSRSSCLAQSARRHPGGVRLDVRHFRGATRQRPRLHSSRAPASSRGTACLLLARRRSLATSRGQPSFGGNAGAHRAQAQTWVLVEREGATGVVANTPHALSRSNTSPLRDEFPPQRQRTASPSPRPRNS